MLIFILFILLLLILAFIISNFIYRNNCKSFIGGDPSINNVSVSKYSYSIYNGDVGLVYNELKILLAKYNFYEAPLTKHVHVSFGSASGVDIDGKVNFKGRLINGKVQYWDPLFTNQKAVIKNTLGGHKLLSEKIKLYETIKKLLPVGIKYIPKTYTITEFESDILNQLPIKNKVFILKKNNVDKQNGVRVFSEKNEYFAIKKEINIKFNNAVIMEYITNPLLTIDGKKFHLRIIVLLVIESGIKRCYILDEYYRILTSVATYVKGDWLNKQIHISCATNTTREYKYPNDIPKKIDEKKFNEFKKSLAFAIAFNNSIIYEENDIGYHIYGVDALVTDDDHFFILEFNGHMLGHNAPNGIKGTTEGDLYRERYSSIYFSFILNSTVFPIFGIKRRPIPYAEVCSYGVLSPFFNILTGDNRCMLIPYLDALPHEIETANKIYFHNESIQLKQLLKICYLDNIFLINTFKNSSNSNRMQNSSNSDRMQSIGYITLDKNNYLTIVVMEEYQNRGIATAMIAQFLEMYAYRHFHSNDKIYMIKKNAFIEKIASKLHFTLEKDLYSRNCRINDITIKKVNGHKLLTYQFIEDSHNSFNYTYLMNYLNKNMVKTNSQFVNLSYSESGSNNSLQVVKSSTGSKYNKLFLIQGSELKSALNINIKTISIYQEYYEKNNYRNRNYDQYDPYLYNGYRIDLHLIFILYISNNGIKKCYYMKDNIMVARSDILFEDELKKYSASNNYSYKIYIKKGDANYKWPDTFKNDAIISDMQNRLDLYIDEIATSIINSHILPYNESNSGFSIFNTTIDFIKKKSELNQYMPQFRNIYTHIGLFGFDDKQYQDNFSHNYYDFIAMNIINPHFGLQTDTISEKFTSGQFILPLKCVINTALNVDANIISKLHLKFNTHRNHIEIYLLNNNFEKIGHIDLNIDNIDVIVLSHIELLTQYRKQNIAINVLFILMEILAAYYAPLNISLKMSFVKPIFKIAHDLQFHKAHWHSGRLSENNKKVDAHSGRLSEKDEEYFIRLCRI